MTRPFVTLALTTALLASVERVSAADFPVAGKLLTLRNNDAGRGALTIELRDPAIPVPAVDGPDDPSLAGLGITVFGGAEGDIAQDGAVPGRVPGGWRTPRVSPKSVAFNYHATEAGVGNGVRTVVLRTGPVLKLGMASSPLNLVPPEGAVAVRLTWGSVRVCALFDDAAVRFNDNHRFVARDADAPAVADCDDATLLGALQ